MTPQSSLFNHHIIRLSTSPVVCIADNPTLAKAKASIVAPALPTQPMIMRSPASLRSPPQPSLPCQLEHRIGSKSKQQTAISAQFYPIQPRIPYALTRINLALHLNTSAITQGSASLVVNLANPWLFQHRPS
jgi:hypothetical protein